MRILFVLTFVFAVVLTQAQNTNYGTNAGNGGSTNTSIGYAAGDVVAGNGGTFLGHYAGRFLSTGNQNSFVGAYSGYSTTNGSGNSYFGNASGFLNSSGSQNTFLGSAAGELNTSGAQNTFSGALAGKHNSTASSNSYFGFSSGYTNSTGVKNAFFGSESGFYNTASYNTLLGYRAGYTNTTGGSNTYVGNESGYSNSTGSGNSFFGSESGKNNSSGYHNTFLGEQAGVSNTSAAFNTFVGSLAGANSETGGSNILVGSLSGYGLTSGQNNVMVGSQAGEINNGSNNVFIGTGSGGKNTGSGNVFIGDQSGYYSDKNSNKLIIHNNGNSFSPLIFGDFQNLQVGIGTSSLGTYTLSVNGDAFASGLWLSSDKRFKHSEATIKGALEKIDRVAGVSYQFKKEETNGRLFSEGTQLGFIAQDLQKVFPELVKESSDGYLAVNYSGMIPVLVEAIKELKAEISQLKEQTKMINSIQEKIDSNPQLVGAQLEQNHPNPFNQETTIAYTLPEGATSAALHIFDLTGKQIDVYTNLKIGRNELSISTSKLAPGLYNYSLVVNGNLVDTKKMLITN